MTKFLAEAWDAIKQATSDIHEIHSLLVQINNRGAGTEFQRLWDDELRKKSSDLLRRAAGHEESSAAED